MRHELSFDPQTRIMTIVVKGAYNLEETIKTETYMKSRTTDLDSYFLLADLREASASLDKEVRKRLQNQMSEENLERVAMVVTNPAVRMIGKVVIATMGKSGNTRFFKTTEEGLAWLKDDTK
ncbi:hypothetical protein GF359_00330 [candidate division WOR-3 bacterium]|uniref:DUF7793 domain-containing protein n=1 Tax=candidate division WOR-3 bacterium TaxID=2052148 RepID=A0A9D5K7Q0_UNCW3|nr:hypothetical protein [candidate division WOR-3 bacterium]MBD3363639.1 hypothetical protein [candidate division WOR-3 bacterium]